MNTLIIAGLMAFGLLALIAAVFLAMDENKTASPTASSSITEVTDPTAILPAAKQQLSTPKEEAQAVAVSAQFSELSAQLRALQEQVRTIEHRLGILSDIAEKIGVDQFKVSVQETDNYSLLGPVNGTRA